MIVDLLAPLGAVIVAAVVAYLSGRRDGRKDEQLKRERERADTHERMSDADLGIGATTDDNREWLRDRGER